MRLYILVDASYYCFYRYHALLQWWRNARADKPLDIPVENEEFVSKFCETFTSKLEEIPAKVAKVLMPEEKRMSAKRLKELFDVHMWAARDCRRQEIWRMELFPAYKGTRDHSKFQGGPLFQIAYDRDLFQNGGVEFVMKGPRLEADDCVATAIREIKLRDKEAIITIIANDHDYLQLTGQKVRLIDLKYNDLSMKKGTLCDGRMELFMKTLMGDVSDNIPAAFPKCGPKTAYKCFSDALHLNMLLDKHEGSRDRLALNARLIDMNYIPMSLTAALKKTILEKLTAL